MKSTIFLLVSIMNFIASSAQDRMFTRTGSISFYSKTPLEDIQATTQTAVSVLDKKTGKIEFSVLIKSFTFEKALMQEHFNENYLESDKFPKSTFRGQIDDLSKINFDKDGKYLVSVSGELILHGEAQALTAPAMITIIKGDASADAEFTITLVDYKIAIPSLVKDKISKTVKISVHLNYEMHSRP